jgi:predicted DNA-binding protein
LIYRILEEELGREKAEKVGELIEKALEQIEE